MKHEAQMSRHTGTQDQRRRLGSGCAGQGKWFSLTLLRERASYPVCAAIPAQNAPSALELQATVACPTVKQCMAVLAGLCDESSTGPNLLPGRILKRCAEQLAKPIQSLLQRMIGTACWPESWRERWVVPICK